MGICRSVRTFSSHHEWVGNLFSLLAVALIFGSVWVTLQYYGPIATWLGRNLLLHTPMLLAALAADVLLVLAFLAIGSAGPGEEGERCFRTFRGRRGGGSPIDALRNWLLHMENVGKRHR